MTALVMASDEPCLASLIVEMEMGTGAGWRKGPVKSEVRLVTVPETSYLQHISKVHLGDLNNLNNLNISTIQREV